MTTVTVIDKRSGETRELDERSARILVALGKAVYAGGEVGPVDYVIGEIPSEQTYQTRALTAETPAKRRGRPPKSKEL